MSSNTRSPQWLQEPPALVLGRRVLVVDEISSSGETLRMVREKVAGLGAGAVRSAVLYAHTWGVDEPDYIGLISDALLLNPWDREVSARWLDPVSSGVRGGARQAGCDARPISIDFGHASRGAKSCGE